MLHNEARKLLIKAWNKTHNAKEIAECFSVNTSTVYRLKKRMRETGSVETRTSQRGCKPVLSQNDFQNIDQLIQQQPDITIHEIMEKLQLHVSDETVRKAILKLGYVYKKKSLHASEQERPRCQGEAEKLERTSVGKRRKSSAISRRKWCKHGHDKTLCPFQKEWTCCRQYTG